MNKKLSTVRIQNHRNPLTKTLAKLRDGKLTVGFIGGSITDGRNGLTWPEPVTAWFVQTFPDARIVVENAAIGGTGSALACFRADQYLIDRKADLVFVEYATNDWLLPPERNRRTQEGLIRKLLAAGCEVVLVYTFWQDMYADMIAGRPPKTVVAWEKLAEHYGLGSVWMGMQGLREVCEGQMRWEEWMPDGVHPESRGSLSYGQSVTKFLETELVGRGAKAAKKSASRRALPAPLEPKNWQSAQPLDFSLVRTEGPWSVRRSQSRIWYDHVLQTAAPGAKLSFDFEGRALVLGFDFDKTCADFTYRLDGGQPIEVKCDERYEWASIYGWYYINILAEDLPKGKHHFEMEVVHGNRAGCAGTNCRLVLVGVVK